jgi:acyl-CoA synthetase (AMP-forming)/AMP-acid ligase II
MLLHDLLRRHADCDADRTLALDLRGRASYGDVLEDALRIAQVLAGCCVRRGDRVVLAMENSPQWIAAFFGILHVGAAVVPLPAGRKSDRLPFVLRDCEPRACIVDGATLPVAAPAAGRECALLVERFGEARRDGSESTEADPETVIDLADAMRQVPAADPGVRAIDIDLAAIIYTSGSTGSPRGVMLSHVNLTSNAESIVQYLGLAASDRVMVVLPFHYVYGLSLLTTHVRVGGSLALDNRFAFPSAILRSMQQFEATGFAGVPSTFALLLHRSSIRSMTFPSLRYVTQAGGPMPPALLKQWLQVLPDIPFFVMYGATEASARLAYLDPADLSERAGSIGKAIPNVELTLVRDDGRPAQIGEVGEIVARGANIMLGYWNRPDETRAVTCEYGFRTGDLARADADGFLYVVGRRQEMLKVGAERVGTKEIEDVLHEHESVHEAAVVGASHALLGEVPVAFVALCPGASAEPEEVIAFCRTRLADHKVPARVLFRPELPKSPAGKIDKRALREALGEAPAFR